MILNEYQLKWLNRISDALHKTEFYEMQIRVMLLHLKNFEIPTIEKLSFLYKEGYINDSCLCYYFISELYPETSTEEFDVVLQNSNNYLGLKDFLIKNCEHALSLIKQEPLKSGPFHSRFEHTLKACFTICVNEYGVNNFNFPMDNNFQKTLINLNNLENHLSFNFEHHVENDIAGLYWIGDLVFKSIFQFAFNNFRMLSLYYFISNIHISYFPDISLELLDNYKRLKELSSRNSLDNPSILICSTEYDLHFYGSQEWSTNTINFIGRNCFVQNLNTINNQPRILICFYGISYKNLFKGLSTCFSDTTFNVSNVGEGILFNFNTN